ncbi:MAG TPA: DNA/RNA non-specific endonuclease [Gemmatimonadaceae bacterium]|nr:DNA/RNA non-specific endonuclease [Gemmatimonadaceae bacterium]
MSFPIRALRAAAFAVAIVGSASHCVPDGAITRTTAPLAVTPAGQSSLTIPPVRFSEIHYDNTGGDVGEAIEVSGPAGTDLTNWSVVLYNGNGGASYFTTTLGGAIPATCGSWGVVVLTYPSNGIQNGDPDGVALVDANGMVIEFLSYEGTFTATSGPALGLRSREMGAREAGTEPVGQSLQRSNQDVWRAPAANTFGSCNDAPPLTEIPVADITLTAETATMFAGQRQRIDATALDATGTRIPSATVSWTSSASDIATVSAGGNVTALASGDVTITATASSGAHTSIALHVEEPTPLPPSAVFVSELHYDNDGSDVGEAIEIEGPAGQSLSNWSIVLYNGNGGTAYDTRALSGTLPTSCNGRGVVVVTYPANGIQNGSPDGIALVNGSGSLVEFISYEGVFRAADGPAVGHVSVDIGRAETGDAIGESLQRDAQGWYGPARSSFGACNVAPPPFVSFTGRLSSDPPLPVGFEDQIFAKLNDGRGGSTASTFTWESLAPEIATIDARGVMHALAAGTMTFRATSATGETGTISLPSHVAVASTTASYVGNTEFGEPTDADASDDYIIRRPQYTSSFNRTRGIPNWVSYDLEASHFGAEDRCDCFTFDPLLPPDFQRYTTADYTDAGTIAGYGIDRGHLARSFDRTSASLDNANTYLFSNVVPQASDNNQGPWATMENDIGDLARFDDKEVYVIAGASGSKGTLKNEGKITIPEYMWKVVVVMPRNHGLADVHSWRDVDVTAVIMPNVPGIRDVDWAEYKTTVNAVERLSGYDLLALLQDDVEAEVESGMTSVLAAVDAAALPKGNATSLTAKLDAAAKQIETGHTDAARNQLDAFVNEVAALRNSGRLSDASASALTAAAHAMIDSVTH